MSELVTQIKKEVKWLSKHAKKREDGMWICKETGGLIFHCFVIRTVLSHGGGSVVFEDKQFILHFCCPECDPWKVPPPLGEPIWDYELVDL